MRQNTQSGNKPEAPLVPERRAEQFRTNDAAEEARDCPARRKAPPAGTAAGGMQGREVSGDGA
ncbi:MAG: hypothetical protein A4E73_01714 [Syntrophaceae bacterium PtaU1.Bin231]|nr:MAG: hypothetical protein A4E73_01714 [Syntrophaceae bacterium PtaU1.Bin231]